MRLATIEVTVLIGTCATAFALGRLAVRAFLNALLGGTLFGGDVL